MEDALHWVGTALLVIAAAVQTGVGAIVALALWHLTESHLPGFPKVLGRLEKIGAFLWPFSAVIGAISGGGLMLALRLGWDPLQGWEVAALFVLVVPAASAFLAWLLIDRPFPHLFGGTTVVKVALIRPARGHRSSAAHH
jgi:hypothetical protein